MTKNNKRSPREERTWKIRDFIRDLENVKDNIIAYLENRPGLDESAKKMWISDIKECYYNVVGSWQMLSSSVKGKIEYVENAAQFLSAAQSRLTQSISELKSFSEAEANQLIQQAEYAFEKCRLTISRELDQLTPEAEIKKPTEKVTKVSAGEYHLPCAVCGQIAVEFKIGYGRFDKEESLVFKGITHSTSLKKNLAAELFKSLDAGSLSGAHAFMKKHHAFEGLDAYCPKCDKIYCGKHYTMREEFDDGFYDCTYGACPAGHKRIIDD